jgi:beta-lactamase class A
LSALLDPLRTVGAARWSAAVTIRDGGHVTASDSLDAGHVLPTASVGKIFLLATVLDDVERDDLDGGELLDASDADQVADSGLLQHLDDQRRSVLDLCRFVATLSDNLATNTLIRRVGLDRVAATTRRLGITRCALHDIVRDARGPSDPPFLSTGAAGELEWLMRRLLSGEAISPEVSAQLVDLLRLNTDLSMVAAAFALDPLAHSGADHGIRLWNKTGTQDGTRADVGCIAAGERVATYAVIAGFEESFAVRSAVLGAMRSVGAEVLAALTPVAP